MVELKQNCLSLRFYMIDGQRHQFLQQQEQAMREIIEQLQRTKVFGQPNLLIQADEALSTFPCSAVARLDIITGRSIPPICTPTWTEAHEITAAEFSQRRREIQQQSNGNPRQMIRSDRLTFLIAYDLLGGYKVFLEAQVIRTEDSPRPEMTTTDLGIARQHSSHAPISFDRLAWRHFLPQSRQYRAHLPLSRRFKPHEESVDV